MHICPQCGHSFTSDGASAWDELVHGIFESAGGPKELGKRVGDNLSNAETVTQFTQAWYPIGNTLTAWDKAKRDDKRLEELTPEEQDAYLMAAAFRKIQSDPDWALRFSRGLQRRNLADKMLGLPDPGIVDAEYEKAEA